MSGPRPPGTVVARDEQLASTPMAVTAGTIWIGEQDVAGLADLTAARQALERGFAAEGRGEVVPLDKTMASFGSHATLHALGAADESTGVVGVKCWTHTPGGADPHLLLFDADDGSLLAVIEAFVLGQLRTSAATAIATDRLAAGAATRLAMIGTGKQALGQVAAVASVRSLREVVCYGRDPERAERFAASVADELGLACAVGASVAEAVEGADVVTLATRASEPILFSAEVRPGSHVNAIGAIDLARSEFEPALLERCAVVATDSIAQARLLSSELRAHYGPPSAPPAPGPTGIATRSASGAGGWERLETLGDLVAGDRRRPEGADLTLYKGMGSGIEDLAVGVEVLTRARQDGAGTALERGGRPRPRLT